MLLDVRKDIEKKTLHDLFFDTKTISALHFKSFIV